MRIPLLIAACLVPVLGACAIEHGHGNHTNPIPDDDGGALQPLTVVVDTNETMKVQGGQGVGVFVQYATGGHWHVSWACDTSLSGLPCDYTITMTGTSIANAAPSQFEASDALSTSAAGALVATTHVTDGVDAVDFDAAPGADMKVDLTVSGLRDGRFLFFVQNGQIDGSFRGNLTDPLIFEPSTP